MIKKVTIEVSSIEKLKEEVAQVEAVEAMTMKELSDMLASMKVGEVERFEKWCQKWGLI